MSEVIPKERLTAFQRWELATFDEANATPEPPTAPQVTVEQLEQIHETARSAGFAEGYAEGLAAGRDAMAADARALAALVGGLREELTGVSHALATEVLDVALALARAMLRQALAVDPERILPVIRETLACLPTVAQPAWLCLNPDDVALVERLMHDELAAMGWQLKADARIERGGCRVETATSEVDATNAQRWQKLVRALGKDTSWLA
jgi:flagellar assembly protein FliH